MAIIESGVSSPNTGDRVQRLSRVGSRVVSADIAALRQQGRKVLSLLPHPECPLPAHVIEAAIAAARDPHSPPSRGLLALRQAIARRLTAETGAAIDPGEQVLATNGAMQALFVSFAALFDPGDEMLVPAPCFFLDGIADLVGVQLRYVQMDEAQGYRWDYEHLAAAITPHTRAIYVNTPENPTGYVLTEEDMRAVARLAAEHGLWVVADESYDRMIYDGRTHVSMLAIPSVGPRTVLIRSCTKSYAMAAWRVGYIVAPPRAIAAMTKVLEWQCLYGNAVCQAAAAAAINGPSDWLDGVAQEFQRNRDILCQAVASTPGLSCVVPQGGPFVFLNVAGLGVDGDRFAHYLLHQLDCPATSGSTMEATDHVRIAFGGDPEVVAEAGRRLARAAQAHEK
ncbi:MAG TPA: aminotransferase class I/II-fold pyridoxal phosphate-dependent enzyme [Anaerolineae bacterium]|nr:aminotransferase class I/II-fold pyridoxal phosphate-dependent enzyme [Anaerolineae bacterium]HPL30582.1 aminotransferase class I/II-fold pyridoxal phosphate-dependent enzyme [Anaerolineae bacterium]